MSLMFKNNATSRLKVAAAAGDPSITVAAGEGVKFPQPAVGGDFFTVTIDDRRTGQMEICTCTARVGDVLTVTRAQEGTAAQVFAAGAVVSNRFTAGTLSAILGAINSYTKTESDAKYVDTAGDTMTGPLVLPGVPTAPLQAATKGYVDAYDAPADGTTYGRLSGAWTPVLSIAAYTPIDVLTKIKTVDGVGSGLDADLLDGNDSAFYATAASLITTNNNVTAIDGRVTSLETAMPLKAPLASPPLTGTPTAPTAPTVTNTTQIATTAFVKAQGYLTDAASDGVTYGRKNGAWAATAAGLAEAPTDGSVYVRNGSAAAWQIGYTKATIDGLLTPKAPLAGPVFTGNPQAPTPATADNSVSIATTAYVKANLASYATTASLASYLPLVGGTLSGALIVTAQVSASQFVSTSAGAFVGTAAQVVLGPQGAGTIYLRPSGTGSATNQATLDSTGLLTINGGITQVGSANALLAPAGNLTVGPTDASAATAQPGFIMVNNGVMYSKRTGTGVVSHYLIWNNAAVTPTQVGAITSSGSATTYGTSSDERLKELNAEYDPQEAIAIIRADPVLSYTWKATGDQAVGWFAQKSHAVHEHLATHVPATKADAEKGEPAQEEFWGIDYGRRTPYLWAALTWALDQIDELTARITALETSA